MTFNIFVNVEKSGQFTITCLTKYGMSAEDADIVTETLIVVDQKGIRSPSPRPQARRQ